MESAAVARARRGGGGAKYLQDDDRRAVRRRALRHAGRGQHVRRRGRHEREEQEQARHGRRKIPEVYLKLSGLVSELCGAGAAAAWPPPIRACRASLKSNIHGLESGKILGVHTQFRHP